jgi:hypothetical protein
MDRNEVHDTMGVPPKKDRDEDSGLHDIRSLASSTKMRLSSRRTSQPPVVDEDILASSSAGWKAVALPEPARMVSLPEISELPAASEKAEKASERKSKKELKAERASAKKIATEAVAVETSTPTPIAAPVAKVDVPAPVADVPSRPVIGARFAKPQQKGRTGLYAAIGFGLAAAAGVGWYVSTQMSASDRPAAEQVSMAKEQPAAEPAPPPAPETTPVAAAPAAVPAVSAVSEEKPTETVATGMSEGASGVASDEGEDDARSRKAARGAKKDDKVVIDLDSGPKRAEAPKDKDKEKQEQAPPKGGEGEPSFDQLLKEAGVQEKKPEKPKLEKKSLSGSDIKAGMNSVGKLAQACYNGQQGTAVVRLTVTPNGAVEKVKVTGVFAGTQVGTCVETAVRSAKFPPWDGGPQTFGYSYLLAE